MPETSGLLRLKFVVKDDHILRLRLNVVYPLDSKLCTTGHVLLSLRVPSRSFWTCMGAFRIKKNAQRSEFVI